MEPPDLGLGRCLQRDQELIVVALAAEERSGLAGAEDQPGQGSLDRLPVSVREWLIVRHTAEYAEFGIVEHLPGAQFWIDDEITCAVPEVDKVLRDAR